MCGIVLLHRHGLQNGQQSWYICHCCFVCCCPSGRQGSAELVIAQWRHLVAPGVALEMLHWLMPCALYHCVHMAIEMTHDGGTFVCHHSVFHSLNHS